MFDTIVKNESMQFEKELSELAGSLQIIKTHRYTQYHHTNPEKRQLIDPNPITLYQNLPGGP